MMSFSRKHPEHWQQDQICMRVMSLFSWFQVPLSTFFDVFLMALDARLSVLSMSFVLTWTESGSVLWMRSSCLRHGKLNKYTAVLLACQNAKRSITVQLSKQLGLLDIQRSREWMRPHFTQWRVDRSPPHGWWENCRPDQTVLSRRVWSGCLIIKGNTCICPPAPITCAVVDGLGGTCVSAAWR